MTFIDRIYKLNNRKVILLILLMLTTTCTVIPGAAKKPIEYKANGTIDSYAEVGAAEVVHGTWFACVKGDEVEFRYFYHELNIDPEVENSPAGTVDHFKIYLTELYSVDVDPDAGECVIVGHLTWDKKWWNIDTGKPEWLKPYIDMDVRVVITAEGIEIDSWNDGSVNVVGTTLNVHY